MDSRVFIWFTAFGWCAGVRLFIRGLRKHAQRRLIENMPTSKIRSLAMGLVEVKGIAVPYGKPSLSPFGNIPCVYYEYKIEEPVRSAQWEVTEREQSRDYFYVEDETGRVLVAPAGAETELVNVRLRTNVSALNETELNQTGERLLEAGVGSFDLKRVHETIIAPGEEIYVMGTVTLLAKKRSGGKTQPMIIRRGNHDKFFYISSKSYERIMEDAGEAIWAGVLGALLTIFCTALLLLKKAYLSQYGWTA